MKLKSILLEEKSLEDLINILKSGKYYGVEPGKRFYRGENSFTGKFTKRAIRKDRKPSDTPEVIDSLVECVRERYYPDRPSRQRSKFASGKEYVAEAYGDVYYTFPPKSGNCWWAKSDAWTDYFTYIDELLLSDLKTAYKKNLSKVNFDEVEDKSELEPFLMFGIHLVNGHINGMCKILRTHYRDFLDYEKYRDKYRDFPNLKPFIYNISKALEHFERYFNDLQKYGGDVNSNKIHELTIEADHYLIARKDWFNREVEPKL